MAAPARKMPTDHELEQETSPESVLLRWVERADGEMELVEFPLTPELFLDPEIEDKMVQGQWHEEIGEEIAGLLRDHFRKQPDVLVLRDVKHFLGPGLSAPAPDASVIRGVRNRDADRQSFRVAREGTRPCLVVEVVSPMNARVRRTDLTDKVRLYERAGIAEYLIVDSPPKADRHYNLLGYRLGSEGRYQPIEPDAEGRFLSETTGLWFQISPDGHRVFLFEAPSGRRLLNLTETRESAETEIARLRAEIERLRGGR